MTKPRPTAKTGTAKTGTAKTGTAKTGTEKRGRAVQTRERIIQRSIQLFNRKGLRNVAVEHIASNLKMSPGNLTYHFPRKHELIAATLDVLKDRMKTALAPPSDVRTARDGAEYLIRLYRTFWDFRFFFNALTYVLTMPELRREYIEFREWALEVLEGDLSVLCAQNIFMPMTPPNNHRLLAENLWSLWLNWLRAEQVRSPNATTPDEVALFDCSIHSWSLCQPLMTPEYAVSLLQEFRRMLPNGAAEIEQGDRNGKAGSSYETGRRPATRKR